MNPGIPLLAGKSAEELQNILEWEFKHLPITHNAPLMPNAAEVEDDTDLFTTLANGYLQNVCQRYLFGDESSENFLAESEISELYMNYPKFKTANHPSLRETNDRVMYLALNWLKKNAGNPEYGSIAYVMNPVYKDKYFVLPYDSGLYARKRTSTPLGSLDDFWHLIQPHLEVYKYDISDIYWLWYGGKNNFKADGYEYFEIILSGNGWLPESLLYLIVVFDDLWGTEQGTKLKLWLLRNQRPLVWANGDYTGELFMLTMLTLMRLGDSLR